MLTQKDREQIEQRGSTTGSVLNDLEIFRKGFPCLQIIAPATIHRGIRVLSRQEQTAAEDEYDRFRGTICKFVPASGAATRMFKELFETLSAARTGIKPDPASRPAAFINSVSLCAFYDDLKSFDGFDENDQISVMEYLLTEKGLNYSSLPKGLLKFHKYDTEARTSFEEHLVEGALYARGSDGIVKIIITVSPEHIESFKTLYHNVKEKYERLYNIVYDIRFDIQKPSTDKIAVDEENKPFRREDGSLLFRPAGHGALIENLNEIDEDVVIIKNIDNVVHGSYIEETVRWKRILMGVLLNVKNKIFNYLDALDSEEKPGLIEHVIEFMDRELCIKIPSLPDPVVKDFLRDKLNRPVRVCGMVKNLGEPGGGPYIACDPDGSYSPQILENAQLDATKPEVARIIGESTHFNPVDIVCSLKNYREEKFDLHRFIDSETGFISNKSLHGRNLKALELPGLWNGAMSQWNTVFVKVPVITFNPVKTVFDLLRKEHIG